MDGQEPMGGEFTVDNCDKEPIHIPGSIQPFGTLLSADLQLERITRAGANLPQFLGREPEDVLGRSVSDIVGRELAHDIRNVLSMSTSRTQRERVGAFDAADRKLEAYVHRNVQDQAIIEIEEAAEPTLVDGRTPIDATRVLLARAAGERTLDRMLRTAVMGLRALTGYDRVMAYRFAADGSGEVVAEAAAPGIGHFLGLRYPAWDIPAQARALQVRNPVRLLSDVEQEPVGILHARGFEEPLDLSLAHLRGISPIHVEYLKNMGVGGTLTLSLVIDGKLWGMFALHHQTARTIGSDVRISVELFAQMISLFIKEREEAARSSAHERAASSRQRIVAETDATSDLLHAFPQLSRIFRDVIACDGLAVVREGKVLTEGSVPGADAILAIAGHAPDKEDLLAETDHLEGAGWARGASLDATAGCLIVRATAAFPLQLIFFRDEVLRQVNWAGKPEKEFGHGPQGPRITPRGSFEAYQEEQRGRADPWTDLDLAAARELQIMLTQITAKGERAELSRHKDLVSHKRQQDLMIAELNHRVKNILALIRSLSRHAQASSTSMESYARALEDRISALAAAHDLAVNESRAGVSLRKLVETELRPYIDMETSQVILSGPPVGLRADVAPMIALVLHEIVTNANKYGALSNGDGIVQVRWATDDDGLVFRWREIGGPEVVPPSREGFGSSLIEKAIPYEFDGKVDLSFEPTGVKLEMHLPQATLSELVEDDEPAVGGRRGLVGAVGEIRHVASGKVGLLVEDNLVLAMDMVDTVTKLGAERLETAATIPSAEALIQRETFDFAILDMNLRGTVAFDFAESLRAMKLPFVFVTGYGTRISVPQSLAGIPILTKPVDDATLSAALSDVLG